MCWGDAGITLAIFGSTLAVSGIVANGTPAQIAEYLALVGDTSDNIPGIDGVGPKTTAKWLAEWGGLEQVIAHAAEVKPERIREAVEAQFKVNVVGVRVLTVKPKKKRRGRRQLAPFGGTGADERGDEYGQRLGVGCGQDHGATVLVPREDGDE